MKKYTKIKRLGHKQNENILRNGSLILKEKLDGANFRFTFNEEGQPVFGSKNVEYRKDGEPVYSQDEYEKLDGRFTDAIEHIQEKTDQQSIEDLEEVLGHTNFTFFAENMVQHSLDYPFDEIPQVIGFDVYDHEKEEYVDLTAAYTMFEYLGIETAPIVDEYPDATEFDPENYEIPESEYRDGKMEGVIIINQGQEENHRSGFNTRAKMVTDEFAEKHKKATGANQSREAIHGHEKIVSKYCTDNRIEKTIYKMMDEGRDLEMGMMENRTGSNGLAIRVAVDIIEEEADGIVRRNDKVDWSDYRSLVAKRCVHVLRQEIQKNASSDSE